MNICLLKSTTANLYSAILFISAAELRKSCLTQWVEVSGANSPQGDLLFSKVKTELIQGK